MDVTASTRWITRRLGLRGKIILPLAGLAVVASVLGVVLIHMAQLRQRERHLHDRAASTSHALIHAAKSISDPAELRRFVAAMACEESVETIVLAAGDPLTVIASTRSEWLGLSVSDLGEQTLLCCYLNAAAEASEEVFFFGCTEDAFIDYVAPLQLRLRQSVGEDRVPGAVVVRVDGRKIQSEQVADTTRLTAGLLVAIGLSSFLMYTWLRRVLIDPIAALGAVARRGASGAGDARIGWSRQDELGQLGTQFDTMLDEIAAREQRERLTRERSVEAQHAAEAALTELRTVKFAMDQHAIVAITDAQGVITYANDRFCEISQYAREELIGQTHRLISSGIHPPAFWQEMWREIGQGKVWRAEVCNRAKSGRLYWVDMTVVPFQDASGQVTQYVAIRSDITRRRQVEADLAEREQQFRTLVNNIPGVPYRCLCDEHWTMLFMADAVSDLTGYAATDFINNAVRTYASTIHPDDRQYVAEAVAEGIAKRGAFALEYRIVRADGEVRTVSEHGQVVFHTCGQGTRCLDGAIFDISDRKRAEQQLLDERARLAAFVEHAPAAIAMFDRDLRYVAVSRRFVGDYHLEGQVLIGRRYDDVRRDIPVPWDDVYERGLAGEVLACDEQIWQPEECREDHYLKWEVRPWSLADGQLGGVLLFTEDITEMKRAEAALRESKEQFELAVRGSNDGIWDWNIQTGVVYHSQRYKELLGLTDHEFPDRIEAFKERIHPEDAPAVWQKMQEHLDRGTPFDVTLRLCTVSGQWCWFRSRGEAVRDSDGRPRRMAGSISDISSLKKVEEELKRAARLDRLTGLPNRGLFLDRLQQAIRRSDHGRQHLYAVMFLDFDRFKLINDSLGHEVGDALLVEIAKTLRQSTGAVDSLSASVSGHVCARLGGDEFVILLDEVASADDAVAVAYRLLQVFSQPRQVGKHEVCSTASIGIVIGDATYERAEDVVRDADTAMYEAKRRGKACFVFFDTSMRQRVQRRLMLENDLRRAIGSPQLRLLYQPIVSLRSGELYGVEALMRWDHPTEGTVDPAEFIPIAEESDLVISLGEWALTQSCRQMARWCSLLGSQAPRKVCVNLSRKEFAQPDLVARVGSIVAAAHVAPSRIQLEVTEDAFVSDVNAVVRTMQAIKRLGLELAIDEFGIGTSSFAALHQFPVDVLKIHRSMLAGIEDSKDVASLIHGLAVMVRNMGIDLVAEGIETPGQVIALRELGCDFAQGFYFSRPLTADALSRFAGRSLGLDCNTRGAVAYAHQWGERLTVFEDMSSDPPPTVR